MPWYGSNNQNEIPVVQGVAVPANQPSGGGYVAPPESTSDPFLKVDPQVPVAATPFNGYKGEQQPKEYKDVVWAVAFVAHLVVMMVVLSFGTAGAVNNGDNAAENNSYGGVAWCVIVCSLVAAGLSSVALGFMMQFATELVKVALIFSVVCSLGVGISGLLSGQMLMAALGFASFAIGCCYAYFVWSRIPFAAANLRTALAAVRANLGVATVAYGMMLVAGAWSVWWFVGLGATLNTVGSGILFLFLLSYYWVHEVLRNTVHVSVVGVVGSWWFVPEEASSCCAPALMDSVRRATTYSFGSICFGSLLVATVQALRAMRHMLRENDDFNFIVCLIDCILACIQSIIEYLNKWAYVYVGLYGYGYLEAGSNVITLFQNKGWTTIITDDLADNVLFMVTVGIALATGLVGLILGKLDANLFAGVGYDDAGMVGFVIGLFVGYLLAGILMSVVASAVNTVIVCFAEAPAEFQANHPELSNEMRAAWRQAWPVECSNM